MNEIDEKELERLALKDGEIDPNKYAPEAAGCLRIFKIVVGLFIAVVGLLELFFDITSLLAYLMP
jgi:hypothetical protein